MYCPTTLSLQLTNAFYALGSMHFIWDESRVTRPPTANLKLSDNTSINDCRQYLFTKEDRQIDKIPQIKVIWAPSSTCGVSRSHCLGQVHGCDSEPNQSIEMGIGKDGGWSPVWSKLPVAQETCLELIRCKCSNSRCTYACKCVKNNLKCTDLCVCGGDCNK